MLYDLLKKGPHTSALLQGLARFTSLAAHGRLNADLAPFLGAANLIPLKKPDGGVRPVAVGETIRRLVGKALLNTGPLLPQLKAMAPSQCGVGVTNACESIGMGVQSIIRALRPDGDWAILQLDITNAFNTVCRTAVLRGSSQVAPAMFPWVKFLYQTPAHLFCQGTSLLSKTGVHQGCPLGPAAFAVAIHDTVSALASEDLIWHSFYLDDGVLIAPLAKLADILPRVQEAFSSRGLCVNLKKCTLWGPASSNVQALPENHPLRQIPITKWTEGSGLRILGVPIGHSHEVSFQKDLWQATVNKLALACDKLGRVPDPQVQHCLLRQCLDAAKLQFLLRTTGVPDPPSQLK